jgi:hypothetical protein
MHSDTTTPATRKQRASFRAFVDRLIYAELSHPNAMSRRVIRDERMGLQVALAASDATIDRIRAAASEARRVAAMYGCAI